MMSGKKYLNSDSIYADQLRKHYAPLVLKHEDSFRAADWGSSASQDKRFEVLLGSVDFRRARILDVGCGLGHLVAFLSKKGFQGSYLGVDAVPEMIEKASLLNSDYKFQHAKSPEEVGSFKPDLVLASGLFTFANEARLKEIVSRLFRLTSQVLAFNSLSSWAESQQPNEFYADPISTLNFCATLTKRIVFKHDYMPHDFSIFLYK